MNNTRILIYTIVTTQKHCDEFLSLFHPIDGFDYLLITSVNIKTPPEGLRVLKMETLKGLNLRQLSRLAKMKPRDFFKSDEYDWLIYCDSNIRLDSKVNRYLKGEKPLILFRHNRRNYVMVEILYCYYVGLISFPSAVRTSYQSKAFRFYKGLFQGGVLIRKIKDDRTLTFDQLWHQTYSDFSTDRDQISLAYVVYKLKNLVHVVDSIMHDSPGISIKKHEKTTFDFNEDRIQRCLKAIRQLISNSKKAL